MEKRTFSELKKLVFEGISYVQLSAGRFPSEHKTSLEREFEEMLDMLDAMFTRVRRERAKTCLSLAIKEVEQAFLLYKLAKVDEGRKLLDSAEWHISDAFSGREITPTFVVDAEGRAKKL